ncbi:MAG TPA: response regulator [Methanoregulaceae archaeon]|nr:response regulator [Methanoregulaceae archaeon]HPD75009.1 response regulator [Methanoregulaceae archaeon]HRY75256.1 response regulator [Methanoregulaceae archaeon]
MSQILVVDDEAIITMQLEERLSAMGYTVAGMSASGEDAIEKARRLRPDLVLMDIVMPGKLNGIEAAQVIADELDIPVVFVTSYADDAIIEKAKHARPYGYIVKPFNEMEIKAAIEVALFRKTAEQQRAAAKIPVEKNGAASVGADETEGPQYLDLPDVKAVLLKDIFTDLILFLYTDQVTKDPIFKFALEEGMKKGGRNLFAYFHSTVHRHFMKEIQKEQLFTHRLKRNEVFTLLPILEKCTETLQSSPDGKSTLKVLLDFSDIEEFEDILAVKRLLLSKKTGGVPVSGIIALNIGYIDHTLIKSLAEGIEKIIVSTGKDTTLSFAHRSFPAESVAVVPQATIDDVVKKSLEPVVLSLLTRPISGYEIVHEIHHRYNVLIPQARVYTLLYILQQNGYLEIKMSGKSKLYCPTEKGKKFIAQKLNDFKQVFQHVLTGTPEGILQTGHRE